MLQIKKVLQDETGDATMKLHMIEFLRNFRNPIYTWQAFIKAVKF